MKRMTAAQYRALPKKRRHKYGAKRTTVDDRFWAKVDKRGSDDTAQRPDVEMAMKQARMSAAEYRATPKKRQHKYNATPTIVDGIRFASTGEAMRWKELKLLQPAGKIVDLKRQVPYELHAAPSQPGHIGAKKIGKYVADFEYVRIPTLRYQTTVEDYKGYDDKHARWKRKHAEAEYGIKILLTGPAAKPRRKRGRAA